MKLCLRQFIRPGTETKTKAEGVGDCRTCQSHKDNKNCRLYYPITITTYEVKEKE